MLTQNLSPLKASLTSFLPCSVLPRAKSVSERVYTKGCLHPLTHQLFPRWHLFVSLETLAHGTLTLEGHTARQACACSPETMSHPMG